MALLQKFSGAAMGMPNAANNRQSFVEYVEAYFDSIAESVDEVVLAYTPQYTAKVIARSGGRNLDTKVMPIPEATMRRLLRGLVSLLRGARIEWRVWEITITKGGFVESAIFS